MRSIILETPSLVRVEMTNRPGVFAIVDRDDFTTWTDQGHSTRWFFNGTGQHKYVRTYDPECAGGTVSVVRLMFQPAQGRIVRYRNGNRLDLRRENIIVTGGYSTGRSPADELALGKLAA